MPRRFDRALKGTPTMRALDRLPRRRASGTLHRLLVLVVAVAIGGVVSTGFSQTVSADPPAGTVGAYSELDPSSGGAAGAFVASYWYIDPEGAPCAYSTADFTWDAAFIRTVDLDVSNPDPVSC